MVATRGYGAGGATGARRRPGRDYKAGCPKAGAKASWPDVRAQQARNDAAARSEVVPPPGLAAPSAAAAAEAAPEAFAETLRDRPLPPSLAGDSGRLERFESALLSCVEGLYRDRLVSTLGEVQDRLRSCGWLASGELGAVLPLCARRPQHFKLVPPSMGEPPRVLLRELPPWFAGFQDVDSAGDKYAPDVWEALARLLAEPGSLPFKGGTAKAALELSRRSGLPASLRRLPLGELRHMLHLALGPRKLLRYAPRNGKLLAAAAEGAAGAKVQPTRETKAAPKAAPASGGPAGGAALPGVAVTVGAGAEAGRLASAIASQPLPPAWAAKGETERGQQLKSLQTCIEGLYYDRLEPTLREVQQRLRAHGWSYAEAQEVAMLCAREPKTYEIVPPEGGKQARIQLRKPPIGFRGFVPAPGDEAAGGSRMPQQPLPAETWQALGSFLNTTAPVLKGGIDGAALALRHSTLPHLQKLSLGELRDLIRRAVDEKGPLLVYAGSDLQRSRTATHGRREADGRIYSQI